MYLSLCSLLDEHFLQDTAAMSHRINKEYMALQTMQLLPGLIRAGR